MKWFLTAVFVMLLGTSSVLYGEEVEPTNAIMPRVLDIKTARELALKNNPILKQIREGLNRQDGTIRELQSSRRPHLDIESSYQKFDDRRQQSFGSGSPPEDSRWDATAEASLAIYAGGRNRLAINREQQEKFAVEADLDASTQDLLADVHETYYDAQLSQETVAVQEESIALLEEQLAYAKNRWEAGVGNKFDVMQAEVALANERPSLIRAMNDYRRNIDALRRILGVQFEDGVSASDIELTELGPIAHLNLNLTKALHSARENRSEFDELEYLLQAAREDAEVSRRENIPVVDVFANYGAESDQFGEDDVLHGWTAGIRMNWALGDGGASKGRVMQKMAALQELQYREEEVKHAIDSEVRQAFYDYEETRMILDATELVVDQAEEALRLARNRYQAGQGTQLEVLESQLQLTRARLEYSSAVNSMQRSLVRITRSVGIAL